MQGQIPFGVYQAREVEGQKVVMVPSGTLVALGCGGAKPRGCLGVTVQCFPLSFVREYQRVTSRVSLVPNGAVAVSEVVVPESLSA